MLPTRLMILPFLQRWDGAALELRLLTTPQGDPLTPLVAGEPAFVDAAFTFELRLISDAGLVPTLTSAATPVAMPMAVPPQARTLAEALKAQLPIDTTIPTVDARTSAVRFMKYAPPAYRDATGYRGGSNPFLLTDDSYHCAIKAPVPKGTKLKADPPKLPWGKVLAQALRQPLLAEALGLVRVLSVTPPAGFFDDGGWIYATLAADTPGAGILGVAGAAKLYAARVPPLRTARSLFTPVLFPVAAVPPAGVSYDTLFRETVEYDDGFAKAVYARQPLQADPLAEDHGERPVNDQGVQLGWDDEQVVTWLNRQVDPAAATQDAPMGVFGYRVDARHPGDPEWQSLVRGETSLQVGDTLLGPVEADFRVEIAPSKLFGDTGPNYWLPSYYTAWTGPSLAAQDPVAAQLRGLSPAAGLVRGVAPDLALRYGEEYEFRVRLADLAGGGPPPEAERRNPAPQPSAPWRFVRWVRPGAVRIEDPPPAVAVPDAPPASLVIRRPLLAYPAAVFAGGTAADLLADMPAANAEQRPPGLPDPDAALLEIDVQVESPGATASDGYLTLYTTTRPFPASAADPLQLDLAWQDIADARTLPVNAGGAIALPTSRRVRLVLRTLCEERADYYGADDVRRGPVSHVVLRRSAEDERGLLLPTAAQAIEGIYLQPAPPAAPELYLAQKVGGEGVTAPRDPMGLLAEALDVECSGLTLRGRRGKRTLFGCSPLLRHVIGPDGASLTFGTAAEITRVWLVSVRLDLMRDWSWDGLDHLSIRRDGAEVGRIAPRGRGGHEAFGDAARDRSEAVFLDAIDPKPAPGKFPAPLSPVYRVVPVFRRAPLDQDEVADLAITLPITTPPVQVPKLVAAGIAMSPYVRHELYASTEERRKALWLELEHPPADPNDRIYARVLAYAPDPVLTRESSVPGETLEPPLPIDPEPIRNIVPGQGDDRAGAGAMQELIPTDSPVHFLVPLPPGLTPDSPELHGFFTYELRFGHTGVWTTAQGRFGRPLRITGVQHAAPQLRCAVTRTKSRLEVSASFADPVRNGRSLRPSFPTTALWALLYAQVHQADDAERRNVLLGTRQLFAPGRQALLSVRESGTAMAAWDSGEIVSALAELTLGPDTPLSCLAVETLPGDQPWDDPLGAHLGYERFLRTSTLVQVPGLC
ncbi:MAG TPA: hypothetical protein VF432_31610 [Thermoanaerobaculia bacterium]